MRSSWASKNGPKHGLKASASVSSSGPFYPGILLTGLVFIVAMDQYFEIISSPDAWLIADDDGEDETDTRPADRELRPTNSARRVKALVEQVTGG